MFIYHSDSMEWSSAPVQGAEGAHGAFGTRDIVSIKGNKGVKTHCILDKSGKTIKRTKKAITCDEIRNFMPGPPRSACTRKKKRIQ
jgi:hypothetical protein